MPVMHYAPKSSNEPSQLTPGWHPGFLIEIKDEATPESWLMYAKSPRLYRWIFAIWQRPSDMSTMAPERQSAVSSQAFTPKGKMQASKSYKWTAELIGREIAMDESIDLDDFMPIPCRLKIERKEDFANVIDLERWEEGTAKLTPALRATLGSLVEPQDRPQPTAQAAPVSAVAPAAKPDDSEPW